MTKRTTLYCAIGAALLLAAPLRFAAAADTVPVIDLSQPADTTATPADTSTSVDTTTITDPTTAAANTADPAMPGPAGVPNRQGFLSPEASGRGLCAQPASAPWVLSAGVVDVSRRLRRSMSVVRGSSCRRPLSCSTQLEA